VEEEAGKKNETKNWRINDEKAWRLRMDIEGGRKQKGSAAGSR